MIFVKIAVSAPMIIKNDFYPYFSILNMFLLSQMTSTHFCRSPFLPKCGQNCLFPIIDRWSLNMTFHHFGGSLLAKIGQSSKMIFHHFGSATPSNKRDCCRDQKEKESTKNFITNLHSLPIVVQIRNEIFLLSFSFWLRRQSRLLLVKSCLILKKTNRNRFLWQSVN